MSCRCGRNINRTGQVMGEFGIPRIELRGPGCINGTGRCNVAGAGGRCTNRFGTGNDYVNRFDDEVAGDFGRRCGCRDNVAGDSGRRCRDDIAGDSGRRCRDEVAGDFGRRRHRCCNCCECLETPITVPR